MRAKDIWLLPIRRAIELYLKAASAPTSVGVDDGLEGTGSLATFSDESAYVSLIGFDVKNGSQFIRN
jgi:hypothetical protein